VKTVGSNHVLNSGLLCCHRSETKARPFTTGEAVKNVKGSWTALSQRVLPCSPRRLVDQSEYIFSANGSPRRGAFTCDCAARVI